MKIERFNENENIQVKSYWILSEPGTGYFDDLYYLFENKKDLFNFTCNKVYAIFQEHCDKEHLEDCLLELDSMETADELLEYLGECISEDLLTDYEYSQCLQLNTTTLNSNVKIEQGIELRREAKKYNL